MHVDYSIITIFTVL